MTRLPFAFAAAVAWLIVAIPLAAAAAEDQPGLDLSEPSRAKPPPAPPAGAAAKPPAGQPFSQGDVALGDKVKAVQRKGFLKKGRVELTPFFAGTVNDAFYQKVGGGVRLAYHLHDSFALALRGTKFTKFRTDNVREGKIAFESQLLTSDIDQQLMLGGIWSPIYGKASFRQKTIVHFDLFLQAGFGLVWSATSGPPLDQGPHVATDLGGGVRFYPRDWMAFELGLLATFYPDQPAQQLPATTQRVLSMNFGLSIFWPFRFDYAHP
jgi:outer membrane beta-barrel protein